VIFYQDRLGTNIGEIKRGAFLQFENMGEMTKAAVSSIEMKFANLLAKVECEYATQGQLKSMAEAVRETPLLNTSFLHATRSVYRDRLGTHIRRLRKNRAFCFVQVKKNAQDGSDSAGKAHRRHRGATLRAVRSTIYCTN
jgi:hypothetical protein